MKDVAIPRILPILDLREVSSTVLYCSKHVFHLFSKDGSLIQEGRRKSSVDTTPRDCMMTGRKVYSKLWGGMSGGGTQTQLVFRSCMSHLTLIFICN